MTIQTLEPATLMPAVIGLNAQATALSPNMAVLMTFDAATDKLALVTWMPRGGTLTGVEFRTGTVSTAGATFQVQIEGVDATGLPDGVAKYTNANGTVVVGTGDDSVWKAVAINGGTGVTTVKGDLISIVLSVSSGTPNTVVIAGAPSGNATSFIYGDMPYLVFDTAGAWAKTASSGVSWCVVLDFGGTYYQVLGGSVGQSIAVTTIGNDGERGMRFSVPFTMSVSGMRAKLQNIAAGGDFRARLYSGTTTVLAESINGSTDIDGDVVLGATQDNYYDIMFSSSVTLAAGTTYYATIWQKTAAAVAINELTVNSAGHMNALGGGSNWYSCNRAAGGTGAWTETTTVKPDMYLWVDGFDDGAGGGGGMLVHPGMSGGIRG